MKRGGVEAHYHRRNELTSYQSFDPNTEIIGYNVLSFIQNVQAEEIKPILAQSGLDQIEPEAWYPQQKWLDVLTTLSGRSSAMFNFVAIGTAIAETAFLPPEVERMSFEQVIFAINDFYQMQHRNGDAGEIKVDKAAENHIILHVRVPYPDDLEYGTAYGFARRFLPPKTHFTVRYDEDCVRCEQGGEETVIHIAWK